jgi:hypothetical protein
MSKPDLTMPKEENPELVEVTDVRRLWIAESRTRPGKLHIVVLHEDGNLTCTCEGWIFRRTCWAINTVKEADDDFTVSI